jgi:hypothetical protein
MLRGTKLAVREINQAGGLLGICEQLIGHAVRRDHTCFIGHTKVLQDLHRVLHRFPVAVRAHHHAH